MVVPALDPSALDPEADQVLGGPARVVWGADTGDVQRVTGKTMYI
jgi:hypothetical protein